MAQITKEGKDSVSIEGRYFEQKVRVDPKTRKWMEDHANQIAYNADMSRWDVYSKDKHTTLQRAIFNDLSPGSEGRVRFKDGDRTNYRLKNLTAA